MRSAVRNVAAIALSAYVFAACAGNAQPLTNTSSYDAVALTAASVASMYRAADDAAIDAYLAGALLDPRQPVGAGQTCVKSDNGLGSRPSPLVNPPLAQSSIAQRSRLAEALAAYDLALASFVRADPPVATRLATNALQAAAFELNVAANAHASGDLFIEDLSGKLTAIAARLAAAPDRGAAALVDRDARPTIRKFASVLAADIAKWHAQALNGARVDYEAWLAYYQTVRRAATGSGPAPRTGTAIPRCAAPSVVQSEASPSDADVASDGAVFPGRDTILARVQAARARYDALHDTSPAGVLSALSNVDEALAKALESPGDAKAASDVQSALANYRDAAQALANGFRSL